MLTLIKYPRGSLPLGFLQIYIRCLIQSGFLTLFELAAS